MLRLLTLLLLLTPGARAQWSTATLSEPRAWLAAASTDDRALFAGGFQGTGETDVVDVFDLTNLTWSTTVLSQPRSRMAATSVAGLALFAGGSSPAGASDRVDVYDGATGLWSVAFLSTRRRALSAVTVGRFALFAGGLEVVAMNQVPSDVVDVYDSSAGTWSTHTLSAPRAELTAVAVRGRAYFAGGSPGPSDRVDVFDAQTGAWSTAALATPRSALASASAADLAFFGGGLDGAALADLDVLDTQTGAWSTALLSEARYDLAAATAGDFTLFAGGVSNEMFLPSQTVDVYDAGTQTWSTSALSLPRYNLAATTVGAVALFGGGFHTDVGAVPTDRVDLFWAAPGASTCGPALPNSSGLPADLLVLGPPLPGATLRLTARTLPRNEFGYFLAGQTPGFTAPPMSQGILCLSGVIARFNAPSQIGFSGAAGTFGLDVDTSVPIPTNPTALVASGETWIFQAWFRDHNPGLTSNFTDGVSVLFR